MNNDFGLSLKAVFKREELKEFTKEVMEKTENFLKKYIKRCFFGGIYDIINMINHTSSRRVGQPTLYL